MLSQGKQLHSACVPGPGIAINRQAGRDGTLGPLLYHMRTLGLHSGNSVRHVCTWWRRIADIEASTRPGGPSCCSLPHLAPALRHALQIVYYDGQMDDSRLCVTLACTAALAGAAVVNHTEATRLIKVSQAMLPA